MPSFEISYPWHYSGEKAPYGASFDTELRVRYYVEPGDETTGVKFDITIEEIWLGECPLCTDADLECGWYERDEESLLEWLFDEAWAEGVPLSQAQERELYT